MIKLPFNLSGVKLPRSSGKHGHRPTATWPVLLLCLPAFVAIWSGWVGLGEMTGFGVINMLPGMIKDGGWATVNTAVTLPIGLETYAAYALHAALNSVHKGPLRTFAMLSATCALVLGGAGQLSYHLLRSFGITLAPWWITAIVATIPVLVLGAGTALATLIRRENAEAAEEAEVVTEEVVPTEVERDWDVAAATELVAPTSPAAPAVPAPRAERAPRKTRSSWDVNELARMLLDGTSKDGDITDKLGIGASTLGRYRRAAKAIVADRNADIPHDWKCRDDVVQALRNLELTR